MRKKISEIKRRVPEARLRGGFVWGRKGTAAASLIIIAKNGGFSNRFDYKYKKFFSYIRPRSKRKHKGRAERPIDTGREAYYNNGMKRYLVTKEYDGARLCDFLRSLGYSRTMLTRLKLDGGLTVNGAFRRNIDPVFENDEVVIVFPDKAAVLTPNGSLAIPVVYEDDDILIYDKPDDILVHPAGKGFDDALGNDFAFRFPGVPFRPLGRLDRHTTGLCLTAKNKLTAVRLGGGAVEKEYIAIAEGVFEEERGTVDAPLLRVPGSVIQRKVDPAGQPAVTHYRVLAQYGDHALIALRLETGRTHQIRVHMAFLGHPLAGDSLYGGGTGRIRRQALHCAAMTCRGAGHDFAVTSPLPADMASLRAALEREQRAERD